MGGIAHRYSPAEAAVQALLAGSDLLLQPPALDAALVAVKDAIHSGRLPLEPIDQPVTRVLRAKARVGLHRNRFVDLDSLPDPLAPVQFTPSPHPIAAPPPTPPHPTHPTPPPH